MNRFRVQITLGIILVLAAAIILLAISPETPLTGLAIALAILGIGLIATARVRRT